MVFTTFLAVLADVESPGRVVIAEGVTLWPAYLNHDAQGRLMKQVLSAVEEAPFYRPRMPRSGQPFSVEETNLGPLGWRSDITGYRYERLHPATSKLWPLIPDSLIVLWRELTGCPADPECCLVNLYRSGARMGLHQDRNEAALDAPVLSVSLGDDALFRIGGSTRRGPTRSMLLRSGDVLIFGGVARLAFHGVDKIIPDTSALIPGGGRVNLTMRRVSPI
jgi:alkylated DNA repair protein (DNA oxidative demethylase)